MSDVDPPAPGSPNTAELRAGIRERRRRLDADEQRRAAEAVARRVAALAAWPAAARIALYVAADGELDPGPIGRAARERGAATYVPVLAGSVLRFAPFDDATRWRPNRFGIAEPEGIDPVDAGSLDLVVVPAVAVDPAGHRVGMGGGWYDRTFGPLGSDRPLLVGVVHDLAVVEALTPEPWDVDLDVVVTPTRTFDHPRRG